jgi:hypothetical protein
MNVIDLVTSIPAHLLPQDLGKKSNNSLVGTRFDNSDIRGCNLMVL